MNSTIGNKEILNAFLEKMESINTDIVPGSRREFVLSSTENVPTMISSNSQAYTTYELSPQNGYALDIENSYIHNVMNFNYKIALKNKAVGWLAVGVSSNSDFANAVYLLLNSTSILQTTLNRIESNIGTASISNDVINSLTDKTNLEEILKFKSETFRYINLTPLNGKELPPEAEIKYKYDYKIPLETFTLALSHMLYIVLDMGRLRLKVHYEDIQKAFKYVYIPPTIATNAAAATLDLIELKPVHWNVAEPITTVNATGVIDEANTITFTYNKSTFMTCEKSDIRQENFDITEQSVAELRNYIAQQGCFIIPCETMTTVAINQSNATIGQNTLTTQLPVQNINDIILTYVPDYTETTFINPLFKSLQLQVNGMPINTQPYDFLDSRAYTDFINAVIDDDKAEPNSDFKYSLRMPYDIFISKYGDSGNSTYNENEPYQTGATNASILSIANERYKEGYLLKPNMCMLPFKTAVNGAFHTGLCLAGQTSGSAQIRITGTYSDFTNAAGYKNSLFIGNPGYKTNVFVTAICDGCIVLQYDKNIGDVVRGAFSYEKPYMAA